MKRIEKKLQTLQEKKVKAFITYITAGLPDMEHCAKLIRAQEEAGLDILELGIPFYDPAADGPVSQDASYRSILKGTNLRKCFELVDGVRKDGCELPIVFMMYYNTVLHYGLEAFAEKCAKVGVDGLIIPDLPLEEQEELQTQLQKEDGTILIQLVSPVSKDRVPKILKNARGFVYCVSSMGVTGQHAPYHRLIIDYLPAVNKEAKIPVMMGFGIRTAEDVRPMKEIIDGAIVGSHFITLMRKHDFDPQAAADYCSTFKKELNEM